MGSGARKWLQYYNEQHQEAMEKEAAKLARQEERDRKRKEKETAKAAKKRRREEVLGETTDEDEEISEEIEHLKDSSGGEWEEGGSEDEEDIEKTFWEEDLEIKIGDWVLVQFQGKKNTLYYVGKVLERTKNMFKVTFCKKQGASFVFPLVTDEAEVERLQIKKKLPYPKERRGHFNFPLKFPNICIM